MILAMLTFCVGTVVGLRDKTLTQTKALPNGAANTSTDGFDLETASGEFLANVELQLTVPALTVTEIADTQTIAYTVEMSAASNFGSTTTLGTLVTSTGAGGAGCAAVAKSFRLPSTVQRYIRVKSTKTGASNASTASMTVALVQLG